MPKGIYKRNPPLYTSYLSFDIEDELLEEIDYFSNLDRMRRGRFMRNALWSYIKKYQKLYGTPEERQQDKNLEQTNDIITLGDN
jgi:hypothetical protein